MGLHAHQHHTHKHTSSVRSTTQHTEAFLRIANNNTAAFPHWCFTVSRKSFSFNPFQLYHTTLSHVALNNNKGGSWFAAVAIWSEDSEKSCEQRKDPQSGPCSHQTGASFPVSFKRTSSLKKIKRLRPQLRGISSEYSAHLITISKELYSMATVRVCSNFISSLRGVILFFTSQNHTQHVMHNSH